MGTNDMHKIRCYSGRVVFDHQPKTAGQAVNQWLSNELGAGSITPNLIGFHRELLSSYGGIYPIISGHISFLPGEELDPRYRYITLLRNPVDRSVSWMFYLIQNVEQTPETVALIEGAKLFLASEGADSNAEFLGCITNYYVEHFSRIADVSKDSGREKFQAAYDAIVTYDIVGIYEEMPDFLASVADFFEIPPQSVIPKVNVTTRRLGVDQVSQKLRQRIIDLNQLDLRFYSDVVNWKSGLPKPSQNAVAASPWFKYEKKKGREFCSPDLPQVTARLRQGVNIVRGQFLTFDVDFVLSRYVQELQAGIHVFDEYGRWVYGSNSRLLKKEFINTKAGLYKATYYLVADLPLGSYTAGFAFAELLPDGGETELAWYDSLCVFKVVSAEQRLSAGYLDVPLDITLTNRDDMRDDMGSALDTRHSLLYLS
jgi:hypothetical protein